MRVNVARVRLSKHNRTWVLFDEQYTIESGYRENRGEVLTKWKEKFGAITQLIRYEGLFTRAELMEEIENFRCTN